MGFTDYLSVGSNSQIRGSDIRVLSAGMAYAFQGAKALKAIDHRGPLVRLFQASQLRYECDRMPRKSAMQQDDAGTAIGNAAY